jgi:hypothetical protein
MTRKKRADPRWRPALAAAAAGAVLWLAPLPPGLVERWYSRGVYPIWQRGATMVSNLVPFALFDLLLIAAAVFVAVTVARGWRAGSRLRALARLTLVAGIAAIWFQLAWGLNYRRVPIAESLGLQAEGHADDALARFARAAAAHAAATAADLDRDTPITPSRMLAELSSGFERAQRRAGLARTARPGRPKRSLFNPYFRWASIDGVTNPFVPETLVVSGLTPAEAYVTIAHEWAHLAGYASEDEANFVAWLACLEAGGGPAYNAWLFALTKAARAAPREQAREWMGAAGPLAARDLQAIRERLLRSSPALTQAASSVYDRFLRANRVEGGIESYDQVLKLMLAAAPDGRPRL